MTTTYWFNVNTREVETDERRSDSAQLLGPFATREAAESALERAHDRTKAEAAKDAKDSLWGDEED
jgi:hypothetical protein